MVWTICGSSVVEARAGYEQNALDKTALTVEVEQAPGPGVDFHHVQGTGLVGRSARAGAVWLGYDRAGLIDSDDGRGRRVPVIVAVPASTFEGAILAVELTGAWQAVDGPVLVGRVSGARTRLPAVERIAAGVDGQARWLGRDAAIRLAHQARQRYRERRSHARIRGGRAWRASTALAPESARFATPHSAAEYRLERLPPRFVRGLEGILDDDERLVYWVERPLGGDVPLRQRLRSRVDRRAALLAVTDRQLLWLVDHAQPDVYGHDWGVDIEVVPLERILRVDSQERGNLVEVSVVTEAGARDFGLPVELADEVGVLRSFLDRFTPTHGRGLPRRTYVVEPTAFDVEAAARFGQQAEAQALAQAAARRGEVLAMLFNPRRPGQRSPVALALYAGEVVLLGRESRLATPLAQVAAITLTMSALVGRVGFEPGVRTTYPAPLMDVAATFVRSARRLLAGFA